MNLEIKIIDSRLEGNESYMSVGACAMDLRACRLGEKQLEKINLYPGGKVKIGAGFAIHLDENDPDEPPFVKLAGMILPRSGLGSRGIRLGNVVGLVDSDFQGEIIMAIENQGEEMFVIEPMMRLAQMMIVPAFVPSFTVVEEFTKTTERGAGGFGSTGHQ